MKTVPEKKRVIFLDIDGVLCTARSHFAHGTSKMMLEWDVTGCALIQSICEKSGAKIVISSTWRIDAHQEELFPRLLKHGLYQYLFCDRAASSEWATPWVPSHSRGHEISRWIEKNGPISDYLIIDDNDDFSGDQLNRFIQTEPTNGFSAEDYQASLKLFGIDAGLVLL